MSLAPGGLGYDAASVIFVKGFCCEGVEEKAGNLKQTLLGVCKAVLFDTWAIGIKYQTFWTSVLSAPFEQSTTERFFACRAVCSSANLACFSALEFAEADLAESGYAKVPVCLSRCYRGSLSEARIYAELFLCVGNFSQMSSLVLLTLLVDSIETPLIKGKESN